MNRVVITGIGLVTPLGTRKDTVWKALLAGQSGITPVTSFDTSALAVHLGAEIRRFDPTAWIRHRAAEELGRSAQLAVAAARLAVTDAGLHSGIPRAEESGVAIGTSYGEPQLIERYNDQLQKDGVDADPGLASKYPSHAIAGSVADEFDLLGPSLTVPGACAAGNYALSYAFDTIRTGRANVMLAGGTEAFSRATYLGFARLGVIAPEKCQPFDRNRRGMIPGEGAAVLTLESAASARDRGARVYAELLGCGLTSEAQHMTAADPQGEGPLRAMSAALSEAGAEPAQVGYISAHGTGTQANDRAECAAVLRLLGERVHEVPVSSVKSMLGHSMGAASAVEAALCALTLFTGIAPPTMNYEQPDPDCPVDCIPNRPRRVDARLVLSNAFAFGGNASCLCMARWRP